MAQRQPFGFGSAFARETNVAVTLDAQQAVASHALERGGDGGRRDCELFGQASADGRLIVLLEFPDRLQVIFAGDAGGFPGQTSPLSANHSRRCVAPGFARHCSRHAPAATSPSTGFVRHLHKIFVHGRIVRSAPDETSPPASGPGAPVPAGRPRSPALRRQGLVSMMGARMNTISSGSDLSFDGALRTSLASCRP